MKKSRMRTSRWIVRCLIVMMIFLSGCTYQRQHSLNTVELPEEVYISVPLGKQYKPDIVVLSFRAAGYPDEVGRQASEQLCSEMLKCGPRANVVLAETVNILSPEGLVQFAWENKYDYVVTGDILYFLDGGNRMTSKVEQEMKMYSVSGHQLQVVGYAKAVESVSPLSERDYYLVSGRSAPAPSATLLMERNAGKFARLLDRMLSMDPQRP